MKRAIALWGLFFIGLTSCVGEDPLITEIQKVVEVDLQLSSNRTDSQGSAAISETSDIVGEEFSEYTDQIRDFEINRLNLELHLIDSTPGQRQITFERLALDIQSLETGGIGVDLFDLTNVVIDGGGLSMVIYRSDRSSSTELDNGISFVRSRLLREQPISWELEAEVNGLSPNAYIEIKFLLDLTAEVILP